MDKKQIGTIAVIVLLAVLVVYAFMASANKYSEEEMNSAVLEAQNILQSDINVLQTELSTLSTEKLLLEKSVAESDAMASTLKAQLEALAAEVELLKEKDVEVPVVEETIEPEVESEIIDKVKLGDQLSFKIDDGELSKLIDSEIEFNGEDYDVQEVFMGYNTMVVGFNGYGYDEDFGANAYLVISQEGALKYKYMFDDSIDMTKISSDEPLEIMFLGEPMKIIKANANELKVELGNNFLLKYGEPLTFDNKELKLLGISENKAFISFDGVTATIESGKVKTVSGEDIKVSDVFESTIGEGYGFATIVIGSDVEKVMKTDDEYLDDEKFQFVIESDGNNLKSLSVLYDVKSDELDDEYAPLKVGEMIVFPNGYLVLEFVELSTVNYVNFETKFKEFDAKDDLLADENGLVLKASQDVIELDGEELDEVYFMVSGIYYINSENDLTKADATMAIIVNDDYEVKAYLGGLGNLRLEDAFGNVVVIDLDLANVRLGAVEEEAEASDIKYMGVNFGTLDNDLLLSSGIVILDVEDNADNDVVKFKVPSEIVEATFAVY